MSTDRPDQTWMYDGLCNDEDPDLFFPPATNQYASRVPKAICERCPVKNLCLTFALEADVEGIWGGTTGRERDRLRHELGMPRRPGVKGNKFGRERGVA